MLRAFQAATLGRKYLFLWIGIVPFLFASQLFANDELIEKGQEIFQRQWVHQPPGISEQGEQSRFEFERHLRSLPGDGLGPMHNATSCEACHAAGGGAGVDRNVTLLTLDPRTEFVTKQATQREVREALLDLFPGLLSPFGVLSMDVVVHEKSTRPFYDGIRNRIAQHIPGGAPEQWFTSSQRTVDAIAQQPVLAGRLGSFDFYLSQRNSPPLYGLGAIDNIPVAHLTKIARSQPGRTGGAISGRLGAGKFGWRGQTATLDQFVRGACAGELGLQVAGTPQPADLADETYVSLGADLQEGEVNMLVSYVRSLPKPIQETRLPRDAVELREGKRLMAKIGCTGCHVETVARVRGIYSDLLLHDMGELLQAPSPAPLGRDLISIPRMSLPRFPPDQRPFGSGFSIGGYYGTPSNAIPYPYPMARPAEPRFPRDEIPKEPASERPGLVTWDMLQREWRTPPLWGVADSAPYLHDGRAATLDAAIRWHGGEASASATAYRTLTREGRAKVIAFLASLRAPIQANRQQVDRTVEPVFATTDPENDLQAIAETRSVFDFE